jgi:hypothetical protein
MSDWTLAGVTLPGDLLWQDEYGWSAVRQVHTPTLTGGVIIEQSTMQSGRPITLVSQVIGGFSVAPVTRATLDALRALDVTPRSAMTLVSPDSPARTFSVVFRHTEGVAISATPIDHASPIAADDLFLLTLRLTQV